MSEIKFERNYLNAKSFRGYKRLYVTIYNKYDNSEANATALLQDADSYVCVDHAITLIGYGNPDGRGIGVFIDGFPLGTVWETYNGGSVFDSAWNGSIDGVSIRIERSNPHPIVHLFVKLQ